MVLANLKPNLIKIQQEIHSSVSLLSTPLHFQCDFQRQKSMRSDVCAPMHFDMFSTWQRRWLTSNQISLRSDKKFTLQCPKA